MIRKLLLILVVVPAVLTGCASNPVNAYSGPVRPATAVATFKCGFGISLKSIDGNGEFTGNPLDCDYHLLPGRHTFRVQFGSPNDHLASRWDYIVTLHLVRGRRYSLNAFLKKNHNARMPWSVVEEDSSKKKLVYVTDVHEAPHRGT